MADETITTGEWLLIAQDGVRTSYEATFVIDAEGKVTGKAPCNRYFGIYRDGRLAAMIGERMGMEEYTEISAICTHPDSNGHGYARRLLAWLSNDNLRQGRIPFLHVSQQNQRAMQLYERNGYHVRREIAFWSLRRIGE